MERSSSHLTGIHLFCVRYCTLNKFLRNTRIHFLAVELLTRIKLLFLCQGTYIYFVIRIFGHYSNLFDGSATSAFSYESARSDGEEACSATINSSRLLIERTGYCSSCLEKYSLLSSDVRILLGTKISQIKSIRL